MSDNSDNKRKRDNEKQKDKQNKDTDKSKDDSVTRIKSKKTKTNKSADTEEVSPTKSATKEVAVESLSTGKAGDASTCGSESASNAPKPSTSSAKQEIGSSVAKKEKKERKKKCGKCDANVALIGFECRCGGVYCVSHRYSNEHNCTFDYRQHGAEQIRKNNPRIVGKKV